jgi:hypothetical protein
MTNNFDAEYGAYAGGQINVITKSGTDRFHGDLFEFVRNTDLEARNFYDVNRGAYQQNQFGGTWAAPSNATGCSFSPTTRETAKYWDRVPAR